MSKVIKGEWSEHNGSKVRIIRDSSGAILGTVTKLEEGGYRIFRVKDSKTRTKRLLSDAFKSIARAN